MKLVAVEIARGEEVITEHSSGLDNQDYNQRIIVGLLRI